MLTDTTDTNETAAHRAHSDDLRIRAILGIDTGTTFFAHGTEMLGVGKAKVRRDRADFLDLPTVGDAMDALGTAIQREERADHEVDLGGLSVTYGGRLHSEDIEAWLDPSEIGWQRLASFAPSDVPAGLRTNVNAWLGRRRGDKVRARTRATADGKARELYSVVSPKYVPYDVDAIAADIAATMPADARARVRYDRSRMRTDVVLCNPHHYPDDTGTASVGEAHRLTLRVTTADDGTGGFKLRWLAERMRCRNATLLKGERTVFHASHRREDLGKAIGEALAAQGQVMETFASVWRDAWKSYYLDGSRKGDKLDADAALRRIAYHRLVQIPGVRGAEATYDALRLAYDAEGGDGSVASVHNAITRAAHQTPVSWSSRWADDETEEQASNLLYQKVHVLAAISDEDAEAVASW